MLKAAVFGGPSLVFTRKHEVDETRIRSHKYALARFTKRIVGFDANSLYPSTMLQEMPCGKETVVHCDNPQHPNTQRRQGDADSDKALLAEVFKLLGNSAYGKFIEAVERQTRVVYTTDED